MKKVTHAKNSKKAQTIVAAASMMILPMVMISHRAVAQGEEISLNFTKISWPYQTFTLLGTDGTHEIFKNAEGKLFFIDGNSGDMKMLSHEWELKFQSGMYLKFTDFDHKTGEQVKILGVDRNGNAVLKNTRGEEFFLNRTNGDIVRVHVAKAR
jgi:hypothetical protein